MAKKRKNRHGTGGVYYKPQRQLWEYRWTMTLPDGTTKRVSRYARTEREAKKRLREATAWEIEKREITDEQRQAAIAEMDEANRRNPRFSVYLERWLANVRHTVAESTYQSYSGLTRNHLIADLGHMRLWVIDPGVIRDFLSAKRESGLASRTVNYLYTLLNKALNDAVEDGFLPKNPAARVKPPRVKRHEFTALTPDESRRFLRAASEDRFWAVYVVALCTGLRRGEVLGLTWPRVDLDGGVLAVTQSLNPNRVATAPKNARSRRLVYLDPLAVDALKQHRERQRAEGYYDPNEFVFTTTTGTPVHASNFYKRNFQRVRERAGLSNSIRFHDLRHTAATLLLSAGSNPKVAADMLGHASVTITLDTYSHVVPGLHREAVKAIGAALNGPAQLPARTIHAALDGEQSEA